MADIRIHANSAQHINTYNCLHKLLTATSVTSAEHLLLLKILTFIFLKLCDLIV